LPSSTRIGKKSKRRPKSKAQSSYALARQIAEASTQSLPLVVGKTYLKVENIDLEKLLVIFFPSLDITKHF
jgi:hypothetical protein